MSARRQLRLAVVGELASKVTGVTVMSPGIFPTPLEKLPVLLVSVPSEQKQSINKGEPEFNTTCSLVVQGQVTAETPELAQDAIEDLAYRTENAVLNGYWIVLMVQQFSSVSTDVEITGEGKAHLAGFKMTFSAELFESFDPTGTAPDGSTWPPADPVLTPLEGIDVHADMASPFDATGTYPPGEFASSVTPAPRTTGPDGRDEGALQIDLPQ